MLCTMMGSASIAQGNTDLAVMIHKLLCLSLLLKIIEDITGLKIWCRGSALIFESSSLHLIPDLTTNSQAGRCFTKCT